MTRPPIPLSGLDTPDTVPATRRGRTRTTERSGTWRRRSWRRCGGLSASQLSSELSLVIDEALLQHLRNKVLTYVEAYMLKVARANPAGKPSRARESVSERSTWLSSSSENRGDTRMPPTVPMPNDVGNDNRAETPPTGEETEAGKVAAVDDKGPKACASDERAPSASGSEAERDE